MKSKKLNKPKSVLVVRGAYFTLLDNPFIRDESLSYNYESDGVIVIEDGIITNFGPYRKIKSTLTIEECSKIIHYKNGLIVPGFIDAHTHFPQTPIIASYGKRLLDWLESYTFPMEMNFRSKKISQSVADFFINECLRAGTTTASVFGTIHSCSVDALFAKALKFNMRLIAGKVLMDRHAPQDLLESAKSGYSSTIELIKKWHNRGRLSYAVTPRFAPTSTVRQLESVAKIKCTYPNIYLQTHLAENLDELKWVKKLFPNSKSYLDVYDQFGLVENKSLFAHGIYLNSENWSHLISKGATIVHCPTSNLFLGSGLFSFKEVMKNKSNAQNSLIALGTDIGAGTSFSMLETMADAYKVSQLNGTPLSPIKLWYLATLGGATALSLQEKIGSIQKGKEADLIILDLKSTPLIDFRMKFCKTIQEILFTLIILGDSSTTAVTYIMGKKVFSKIKSENQ